MFQGAQEEQVTGVEPTTASNQSTPTDDLSWASSQGFQNRRFIQSVSDQSLE